MRKTLFLTTYVTANAHKFKSIVFRFFGYKIYEKHNLILEFTPSGKCSLIACSCGKGFWQE